MVKYIRNKKGKTTHIEITSRGKKQRFTTKEWAKSSIRANKADMKTRKKKRKR